ncbi:MAG: methyl-accepting chemotaxis protein [Oscillospiraceae bacterium]|nr:methyl-accepting chemotaxis protein [Oscillospiraceae bacterium]
MSFFKSVRFKLLLMTVGLQMVIAIIFIAAAFLSSNRMLGDNSMAISESVEQSILTSVESWREQTLSYAQIIAHNPSRGMVEAIHSGDTAAIIELKRSEFEFSGADGMTFANMHGYALARVHEPDNFGQNISTSLVIADGLAGRSEAYVFPTLHNGFAIAAGVPIRDGDEQIGVLFLSKRLDAPGTIDEMRRMTGSEIAIFQGNEPVMATFTNDMDDLGTLPDDLQEQLGAGNSVVYTSYLDGAYSVWRYVPIPGRDGDTVGSILTIYTSEQGNWVIIMWIVLFVAICAVMIPLAMRTSSGISKPLKTVDEWLHETATTGNAEWSDEEDRIFDKYNSRPDEVGDLFRSYAKICEYISSVSSSLKTVAGGDLDVDVTVRSEKDILSQSLHTMVNQLNEMFGEINAASLQVSSGSQQISDSAQTLAKGATEQSATVQQLSASMHEITGKTKSNAQMAARASELATTIKGNAERGSKQMDEMMTAVKEINEASQNISKVIKSIDDIAFQTNILALNAAVEAARAGQHGKGFAVVAEEVRNLAAKSADAAKDTETLIADSMEKAELGSRIADGTAASLADIVAGIDESNKLVNEIAESSEEQTLGIEQVNSGIDQVAQVVQQNSATAQESAAASQQMSGQSTALEQLISRFKLKSTPSQELGALPPAAKNASSGIDKIDTSSPAFGKY